MRHLPSTRVPFPAATSALVGRQAELAAVAQALARSRFVTLTGVGGTGKTRLAVEAAGRLAIRYRDGVAFADFSAVHDPALIDSALAHCLGWSPPSVAAAEQTLAEGLHELDLLIVVDNVEQLPGVGATLAELLHAAPWLRLLVTSRIALHAPGELRLRVPPLAVPPADASAADVLGSEAVQLLLQHARRFGVALDSDADLAAAAAICSELDGLPLAIELAAAQLPVLGAPQLARVLRHRLEVLTCGRADRPHRQRTLRAVMDWSYSLLPAHAAALFDRVAVFEAPFDAGAAEAVADSETERGEPERLLAEISEHSLLITGPEEARRFQMLNTVRDYARQRLADSGTLPVVRRRHLQYWRAHTAQLGAELAAAREVGSYRAALARLHHADPDVLAALEFAVQTGPADADVLDSALRLAVAAVPYWTRGPSPADVGMRLLDELIETEGARTASAETRAAALVAAATLACVTGGYRRAAELASEGLALCKASGDDAGMARALHWLGAAYFALGDAAAAERVFHHELSAAQRCGDALAEADAHGMLADVLRYQGRLPAAAEAAWRGIRCIGRPADPARLATLVATLGAVAGDQHDRSGACRLLAAALRLHHALLALRDVAADLERLAATLSAGGVGAETFALVTAARRLREASSAPLSAVAQQALDAALQPAAARSTARQRAAEEERGWNAPLEQTIAQALCLARLGARSHV